jgi:hypothetical protein
VSDMFTHKTREKMCAEIFDVFVICSLSGRTRARWVVVLEATVISASVFCC